MKLFDINNPFTQGVILLLGCIIISRILQYAARNRTAPDKQKEILIQTVRFRVLQTLPLLAGILAAYIGAKFVPDRQTEIWRIFFVAAAVLLILSSVLIFLKTEKSAPDQKVRLLMTSSAFFFNTGFYGCVLIMHMNGSLIV